MLLTAVFVLPMIPTVPAESAPEACPDPCRTVSLHVQPGGGALSALPGDAMPTDPSTHGIGPIAASTRSIPAPLVIAKSSAFVIHLDAATDAPWGVQGSVRVVAIDLVGGEHPLAERIFAAPVLDPGAIAPSSVRAPIDAATSGAWNNAAARYDTMVGTFQPGGVGTQAADGAYALACGSPNTIQCGPTEGAPAVGVLRPCAASPPPNHLVGNTVWTAGQTADGLARDHTGEGVCGHSTWPTVYDGAGAIDESGAGVEEAPAFPSYPLGGNASAPEEWRVIALNATPPAWLPQNDATFTLPDGLRLALRVDLRAVVAGGATSAPLQLEYGRSDALTRLDVRTPTPGAFAMFAYDAEPILAGRHTGAFVNLTDADDFTFQAPIGARIELRSQGAPNLVFTLWDADGVARTGTASLSTDASSSRWLVRVAPASTQLPPREYVFMLTFPEPIDDGARIEEGVHEGALGDGDDVDTYTFFAWHGQRVDATLAHGDSAEFTLSVGERFWDALEGDDTFSGRPQMTGVWEIRVARVYGSGPYTLTLDLNDAENHTVLPLFATVASGDEFRSARGMKGHGSGVDVRSNGTLYHIRPNETTVLLTNSSGNSIGRTSDGRFLDHSDALYATVLRGPSGSDAVLIGVVDGTFGPDAFYGPRGSAIKRMTADRVETTLNFSVRGGLAVLPNGTVIADNGSGKHVLDFDAKTAIRAPQYDAVVAFDLAGNGYFISNSTLIVRRDAETLAHDVVARAGARIDRIAFSEDALYAHSYEITGAILRVPFVGGFAGFEPTFNMAPAADLVPVNASDEIVGYSLVNSAGHISVAEEHVARVSIENRGGSVAPASRARLAVRGLALSAENSTLVPAIPPGGAITIEIAWRTMLPFTPGDKRAEVTVDSGGHLTESNKTNNRLEFVTHVIVGGNYAACVAALEALPPPWVLPYDAETLCRQT